MSIKLTVVLFFVLFVSTFSSCDNNNSSDKEKIQQLENEIESLKKQSKESDTFYSKPPPNYQKIKDFQNETVKAKPDIQPNLKYVFAKFSVSYLAMSGVNKYDDYEVVCVTNILKINDYSEEIKYKLKDLVRQQESLISIKAPFVSNQKIKNITILDFLDYVSASKEREKMEYGHEVSIAFGLNY